jgi:ABC-type transport system involved in multi-copper enzyme maturation permease subunit
LRSHNAVLFRKDLGELFASRAFWLTMIVVGPLVGQAFIQAVNTYAEVSKGALPQGLSPLDGIVVPALGAYELAMMLLFPFVAIRMISAERTSGALKLILQWPVSRAAHVLSKLTALAIAWLLSLSAFAIAMLMWRMYGGHLDGAEVANVLLGYTLRFIFTAAISMCAAALVPGAANAAVVVLAFTIGTWALDFIAAGRGGVLQTLASYTPAAALRMFERGLLRADVVAVLLIVTLVALYIAAKFLNLGSIVAAALALLIGAGAIGIALRVNVSADLSEDRRSSFARADEQALKSIKEPLTITVWLSAEDPRMNDFERSVLVKLQRTMNVRMSYPLAGREGLFGERYGDIEYRMGGRTAMSKSTTEEIVLETIYGLARVPVPPHSESAYTGYPLAARPKGAAIVFYVIWPIVILLASRRSRRTG